MMLSRELSNKFANMGFVGACLVVAYHVGGCGEFLSAGWWVKKVIGELFGGIAVPYFFVASGFFLAGHLGEFDWWNVAIRQRVRTLLIPFVIWNFLYGAVRVCLCLISNVVAERALADGLPQSWWGWLGYVGLDPALAPALGPLWYVRTLVILVVLAPVLGWLIRKGGWWFICCLYLAYVLVDAFGLVHNVYLSNVFHRALSLQGFCFFSIGLLERMRLDDDYRPPAGGILWWLLLAVVLTAFSCCYVYADRVPFRPKAFMLPVLLGVVWRLIPTCRWPTFITTAAFPIFLLHCFFLTFFAYTSRYVGFVGPCMTFLLRLVSCVALSVGAAAILRVSLPRFSRIAFGGR